MRAGFGSKGDRGRVKKENRSIFLSLPVEHFVPSCSSIGNQDKPGTTVRRENTRSHSDLDIYVESSCAICTEIVRETWSKPGERARKLKKALAHWTRNPNCAISLKKKHNLRNIGSD